MDTVNMLVASVPRPPGLAEAEAEYEKILAEKRQLEAIRNGTAASDGGFMAPVVVSHEADAEARRVHREVLAELRALGPRETASRMKVARERENYVRDVTLALMPSWRTAEAVIERSIHNLLESWAVCDAIGDAIQKAGGQRRQHLSADGMRRAMQKFVVDVLGGRQPHGHDRAA